LEDRTLIQEGLRSNWPGDCGVILIGLRAVFATPFWRLSNVMVREKHLLDIDPRQSGISDRFLG